MSDILQSSELNVHDILIDLVQKIPQKDVGISLSSGIDSVSVLLALLECGKNVTVYSFTLDDHESTDFVCAKDLANKLDLKFVPVLLPTGLDVLYKDLLMLHNKYGCIKKTEYECSWPYLYVCKVIEQEVLATGMAADGHFVISKKGILHFKDDCKKFRENYFSSPNKCQIKQRYKMAEENGFTFFEPYLSNEVYQYLLNTTWEECNKPQQKMPIRRAFDFGKYMKVKNHTNFQLGDSGIAKHFEGLLNTDCNLHNYKSIVGIYNSINKGELPNVKRKLI